MGTVPEDIMKNKAHRHALAQGYKLLWYRIERVLGQGNFGITYLATDINLDQPVAIKEYLPLDLAVRHAAALHPLAEDCRALYQWGLKRFISEARTLAKFKHPYIVRVHSVFEGNNTAYMVMDYEQGDSLDALFRADKRRTEAEMRDLLFPLLDGLEQLHAAGFIHRDIKPENIYVRADGTPVLLDFGSARLAVGTQTRTLTSLVSSGFAPFEQYGEGRKQGPWTDIYALGATLYAAISGYAPVDAMQRGYARLGGKADPLEPAIQLARGRYSERFLEAVDAALKFLPQDRPQSLAQWREMFKAPGVASVPLTSVAVRERREAESPRRGRGNGRLKRLVKRGLMGALAVSVLGGALWLYERWLPTTGSLPAPETAVRPQGDMRLDRQREKARRRAAREAERKKREQIAALLDKANQALDALRLTSPRGNNALEYYQAVMAMEPEHREALQGLERVVARYATLADKAMDESRLDTAAYLLGRAAGILPEAEVLKEAQRRLVKVGRLAELQRQREEDLQKQLEEEERRAAEAER